MKTSELVATAASQVACRLRRLVLLRAAACTNIIIIFFINFIIWHSNLHSIIDIN